MVFDLRSYRGEVKIQNPETGNALVFKVERQPSHARFAPGKVIVYLLVGRNRKHWRAWRPFAFVDSQHGALVWRNKSGRYFGSLAMLLNDPEIGHCRGYTYHYDN